jgi:hypothetical protein
MRARDTLHTPAAAGRLFFEFWLLPPEDDAPRSVWRGGGGGC